MNKSILTALAILVALPGCGQDEGKESEVTIGSLKRITSTGAEYPQWSPNGTSILYSMSNRLYTIAPTGVDSLKIATMTGGNITHPHWNPANPNQVCFINRSGQVWEIYTMTIGEDPVLVHTNPKQLTSVSFTRDGTEIAFTRDPGSTAGVMIIPAAGGNSIGWPRQESWGLVTDAECAVDADLISFVEQKSGQAWNVMSLSRDGGNAQRLSNFATEDDLTQAARSYDGSRYCIRWGKHFYWTEFNLYMMSAAGGEIQQLTKMKQFDPDDPAWSPDGNKIVFTRQTVQGEPSDLFVVDMTQ